MPSPLSADWPGALPTKRADKGHKLFGPFRVMFRVGLQVFHANRRLKNNPRWKPYFVASRFRTFSSLRHLDLSLAQQARPSLSGHRRWAAQRIRTPLLSALARFIYYNGRNALQDRPPFL